MFVTKSEYCDRGVNSKPGVNQSTYVLGAPWQEFKCDALVRGVNRGSETAENSSVLTKNSIRGRRHKKLEALKE